MNPKEYFEQIGFFESDSNPLVAYIGGFVLSIIITLLAFWVAATHALTLHPGMLALAGLALLQFLVQLFLFLHLNFKRASWERLIVLCGAIFVVTLLVGGSLWIMWTLNGRMMPGEAQMEQYMNNQGGF